jgi:molybdate transport system substrate-binding protein
VIGQAWYVDDGGEVFRTGAFEHLAVASPKIAPHGAAAVAALTALHLIDTVQPKLVQTENIAQARQFVASGNAELGLLALSQDTRDAR